MSTASSSSDAVAAAGAPARAPACRKCGAARADAVAPCPRCGLDPARAAAWEATSAIAPTAALEAAWAAVEATWTSDAAHERASAAALATGDYAWLATRYRAVLRDRPGDPIATAQLDRITRRAQAALVASADSRGKPETRKLSWVPILVAVAAIAAGTIYAAHVTRERTAGTGRRRPVEPVVPAPSRQLPVSPIEPSPPGR